MQIYIQKSICGSRMRQNNITIVNIDYWLLVIGESRFLVCIEQRNVKIKAYLLLFLLKTTEIMPKWEIPLS